MSYVSISDRKTNHVLYIERLIWLKKQTCLIYRTADLAGKVGEVRLEPGPIDNSPLLCPHGKLLHDPMVEYKNAHFYHKQFSLLTLPQWYSLKSASQWSSQSTRMRKLPLAVFAVQNC
jgi:hypothetical protein